MKANSELAANTIGARLLRKRPIALAISRDFDSRFVGELPIVFDGTPKECAEYAESKGYVWKPHDLMIMGGVFEHATEPHTLYPL